MEIKLIKEDYEGYLSQILMRMKTYTMALDEGHLVAEWLKKKISSFPKEKKK